MFCVYERLRGVWSKIDSTLNLFPFANSIAISRRESNYKVPNVETLAQSYATDSSDTFWSTRHELEVEEDQVVEIHAKRSGEKFTAEEFVEATNNMYDCEIGSSRSGTVYKGQLAKGRRKRKVAVKIMCDNYRTGFFEEESYMLFWLEHKHIISLFATLTVRDKDSSTATDDDDEGVLCRMQVFEYLKNGPLVDHLHEDSLSPVTESWKMRISILLGVARAIKYLHNSPTVIHRNISSSNILLDDNYEPRLSIFEFSLILDDDETESADVGTYGGTFGYIDPEYDYTGSVTPASDVYGFVVLMLEVLTGSGAVLYQRVQDGYGVVHAAPTGTLVEAVWEAAGAGKLVEDVRPTAEPTGRQLKALRLVARTTACCLQLKGEDRPTMSDVVLSLKEAVKILREDE